MKHIFRLFAITIFTLSIGSCCKNHDAVPYAPTAGYLIVGMTGGFTMPNSPTKYYLVMDRILRMDTIVTVSSVPDNYSGFHFTVTLPQSRYDSVAAGMLSSIPDELLSRNGSNIGAQLPDAGYTDVRVQLRGKNYNWKFEYDQSASSVAVQTFYQKLQKIVM